MHKNAQQRLAVLDILYVARESKPWNGWVSEYELKQKLGDSDVKFALSVLHEAGHIKRSGEKYEISGDGVLFFEGMQK